jgi:alanyl-tRNA synthetase
LYQSSVGRFCCKSNFRRRNIFLKTLDNGLKRLDTIIKDSDKIINGKSAFELLDTYGFPIDLTNLIALKKVYTVDETEFEEELQKQKMRSRAASEQDVDDWITFTRW